MKKRLLTAVTASLLFATSVFAYPPIKVYVDSQAVSFDQAPIIIDDRTLVPMRAIFQALGSEVSWYEPTKTVTSTKDGDTFVLVIGQTGLYKNGQLVYTMDVPARIINDRTMVPVRAIAEAFDAEVNWDPIGYVIDIASGEDEAQKGYSTTVEAEDGTVVLSFDMEYPRSSSNGGDEIYKTLEEEAKELAEDFIKEYGAKAKKEYEGAKGSSFAPYTYQGAYEMTRDDSELVSFYGTSTQYTGGSETVRGCVSHTFYAKGGEEVELFTLIADTKKEMEEFWITSFGALIDEKPSGFYADAKKRLEKCVDEVGYYLTKDGIAFYLPPETIAPKEAGIVSFTMKVEL
ncbi:MAG: stalk domain-containing protein [Anaerotignum sp.]|nr:stalk domain-containing protein [Anaerotignum sp.]